MQFFHFSIEWWYKLAFVQNVIANIRRETSTFDLYYLKKKKKKNIIKIEFIEQRTQLKNKP